jgi:hypothetical protein
MSWRLLTYEIEIFPLSIRAKGTSIGASSNWMNNFIVGFIVPPMIAGIGWGLYLFFAGWLFLGALFVYFFVPETANKTLEEMDLVFGSVTGQSDKELLAAVREEVGLSALLRGSPAPSPKGTEAGESKTAASGYLESV